jgi:hypothetical protein
MDNIADLIPADFSVSAVARQKILEEVAGVTAASPGSWVVALVWMENETDGTAGPGLGFYERQDLQPEWIMSIDGVDLVFALTVQNKIHFDGKVLDFVDNAFQLK